MNKRGGWLMLRWPSTSLKACWNKKTRRRCSLERCGYVYVCACVFWNKNETKCIQAFRCMGVCLYVKPDVSMCKSNSFVWKTLWLVSLIAHNSDLIKNRNPNTYRNTLDGTLYPVGFAFILVCIFFNATELHIVRRLPLVAFLMNKLLTSTFWYAR